MLTQLLATKLQIPRTRAALVTRPRLLERLRAGADCPLTLLSAPAGFGKTTLAAEWVVTMGWPVAWITLDTDDNDLARFLTYLVAGLQTLEATLGHATLAALGTQPLPPPPVLLAPLLNEINALPSDVILVLDDYHLIEAPAVQASMTYLIDQQPPPLHLVIGTRADPLLPIARLRARGQLNEVRQAELCFTPLEAAALLRQITDRDLTEGHLAALFERTEGWAAGLQMAGASLRGQDAGRIGAFIQAFSGTHRHVLDYLVEEVLRRQPRELQEFLLHTSFLQRLTGPLCEAVLGEDPAAPAGRRPAADVLLQLERANLFITALDDQNEWYRYHPLFAELLVTRLRQDHPDLLPALHRRAAGWYAQHGLTTEAVAHALAAGDLEWAAGLIEEGIPAAWKRGEILTWGAWLKALPEEVQRARPGLRLYRAVAELMDARSMSGVETLVQTARDQDTQGLWRGEIQALRAAIALFRGDLAGGLTLAQEAVQGLEETNPLRGLSNRILSTAIFLSGDLATGCRLLEEDALASQRAGDRLGSASSLRRLGTLYRFLGRLRQARAYYEQSIVISQDAGGRPWPIAGRAFIHLAELAYEWNDLRAAEAHSAEGIELLESLLPAWAIEGYLILARTRQALGDGAGADEAGRAAEALARETETAIDNILVDLHQARLALDRGQLAEAERHWTLVTARDMASPDVEAIMSVAYLQEIKQALSARLALGRGQPEQALAALAPVIALAEQQGRVGRLGEALALRALALEAQGQAAAAEATLQRALALGEPEGCLRTFVDEGAPLQALLSRRPENEPPGLAAYRDRVLAAFVGKPPPVLQPPDTGRPASHLVEPLSERELEVLGLIAQGLSNRDIAEKLFLSLYTVKFYTYNLFGKLGIHSRTQAVARARELGILPSM